MPGWAVGFPGFTRDVADFSDGGQHAGTHTAFFLVPSYSVA